MRLSLSLLSLCWFLLGAASENRNPVGEYAYYKLDRNGARTSGMFTRGEFETKVTHELLNENGKVFQVKLDYSLTVQFMGTQTGSELIDVPAEYFSEEFLQQIRQTGTYETEDFKVRHMGFADARNMDGEFYANCDKLLFYDIETSQSSGMRGMLFKGVQAAYADAGFVPPTDGDIENLKLLVHVKYGLPVLGGVKLDVSGVYRGMNLKAGADYMPNH